MSSTPAIPEHLTKSLEDANILTPRLRRVTRDAQLETVIMAALGLIIETIRHEIISYHPQDRQPGIRDAVLMFFVLTRHSFASILGDAHPGLNLLDLVASSFLEAVENADISLEDFIGQTGKVLPLAFGSSTATLGE